MDFPEHYKIVSRETFVFVGGKGAGFIIIEERALMGYNENCGITSNEIPR